jgi:RES domain-containing protein
LDPETAVKEYQQVSTLLPPGMLVSYQITAAPLADFRSGYDPADWPSIWNDFFCDWREIWFHQRVEPPSWTIGDGVVANGFKGILFRSRFSPHGANMVIYPALFDENDQITVHDPGNALPRNQDSWK